MYTNVKLSSNSFAAGAFVFLAITSLLLILNFVIGIFQLANVWLIAVFLIAVLVNTVVNWKQFT